MTSPTIRASIAPALILAVLLAACSSAGSGSASPSSTAASSASASASEQPSTTPASEPPTDEPNDELGEFGCDFPTAAVGTADRAQITAIRVGEHDGFDRVVFEFDEGIPQFSLDEATPPLLADGSGLPIEVAGNAFLQLIMQGGTRVSPDGELTYDGPVDFNPGFPMLTQLITGGDFEAVSTWYLGLDAAACVRVITLAAPSRLVIDIEH